VARRRRSHSLPLPRATTLSLRRWRVTSLLPSRSLAISVARPARRASLSRVARRHDRVSYMYMQTHVYMAWHVYTGFSSVGWVNSLSKTEVEWTIRAPSCSDGLRRLGGEKLDTHTRTRARVQMCRGKGRTRRRTRSVAIWWERSTIQRRVRERRVGRGAGEGIRLCAERGEGAIERNAW